jgi:GAF domain-containing protein
VNDTLATPQYRNLNDRVRSELAIPILFSDELMGVLDLESASAAAFDENDLEILGALGNNLGGVIANIRLVNQVRQQVLRERQLFDVTSQIRHSVDMETILETSTRELARALGARRASIRITAGTAPLTSLNENTGDAATKQQDGGSNGSGNNGNGRNGKAHGGEDKP